MELAIHLRNVEQADGLDRLQEHLSVIYKNTFPREICPTDALDGSFDRIYMGDEFCPHRIPRPAEFEALLDFACKHHKEVTLLTPPLSDHGIERLSPLLKRLCDDLPTAEVVGNDWGVLMFLKEEFEELSLSAGRVLDKGFKDPRLSDAGVAASLSTEMRAVLNNSSFDSPAICEKLSELGIGRVERDMFPYRDSPPVPSPQLALSLYFPYGYITAGRVCWTATFAASGMPKFAPTDECPRPCDAISMKFEHASLALPVFQSGATVYYLQRPAALGMIFEAARRENVRLVYQGFAL